MQRYQRYSGVAAPDSASGAALKRAAALANNNQARLTIVVWIVKNWLDKSPAERHSSMTWMQRFKRVFNTDIETCEQCGGQVKIIASIEDPVVIEQILTHLKKQAQVCKAPFFSARGFRVRRGFFTA